MATFDYRLNSDYLSQVYPCDTPRNGTLDVLFSDTQTASSPGGGESVLTLSAAGGEYSLSDSRLIGADILLLFRDGLNWYETVNAFTMRDKEFQFDQSTGTITYPPAPFPALNQYEKTTISYIAAGSAIVITEPLTLDEAKAWLKVTHDDEDDLITALITAARGVCEGYTGKSFVERTVTACVRNDLGMVKLPYGPVGNITAAADIDGVAISDYSLSGVADKRLRAPLSSYVKLVYTAGYAVLPQHLKTGLKMQLSWCYVHRGDEELNLIAPDAKAILSPFRSIV